MKYIQSEKNYFYKLYKNGKKKRISFEIYQKGGVGKSKKKIIEELETAGKYDEWFEKGHMYGIIKRGNKNNRVYEYTLIDGSTRKFSEISRIYKNEHVNIPIFDIVKSEEEKKIIRELKTAGKYDEWFEKGHMYGITMRGNTNRRFLKYTVMDGSTRKFSTTTESYWDGQINTPIFDLVGSNSNYVRQGSFKIVPNSRRLNTFGMSTCSGLTMKLGNKKFLSHIDAITDTSEMLSAIHDCLRNQKLTTLGISNVKIYRGPQNSNRSYEIIHDLLEHLLIPQKKIEVVIANHGKCSI